MTVLSEINKITHPGDGINSEWEYNFYVGTNLELRVDWYNTDGIPTTLAEGQTGPGVISYTMTGAGQPDPGLWRVVLTDDGVPRPLALLENLVLLLKPPLTQLISFAAGGSFEGWRHEYQVYDYLTRMALGQQEEIDRCSIELLDTTLDIDVLDDETLGGENASDVDMPTQNAVNKYLQIDDSADLDGENASDIKLPSQSAAYEYITAVVEDEVGGDRDKGPSQRAVVELLGGYVYRPQGWGQSYHAEILIRSVYQDVIIRTYIPIPEGIFCATPVFGMLRGSVTYSHRNGCECTYHRSLSSPTQAVFDVYPAEWGLAFASWPSTPYYLLLRTTP